MSATEVHKTSVQVGVVPAVQARPPTLPDSNREEIQSAVKDFGGNPSVGRGGTGVHPESLAQPRDEAGLYNGGLHGVDHSVGRDVAGGVGLGLSMVWSRVVGPLLGSMISKIATDPVGAIAAVGRGGLWLMQTLSTVALNVFERSAAHIKEHGFIQSVKDALSTVGNALYTTFGIDAIREGRVLEGLRTFFGEFTGLSDLKGVFVHGKRALVLYGQYALASPGSPEAEMLRAQLSSELAEVGGHLLGAAGVVLAVGAAATTFGLSMVAYQLGRATLKKVLTLSSKALISGSVQHATELGGKIGLKYASAIVDDVLKASPDVGIQIANKSISECVDVVRNGGGPKLLTHAKVSGIVEKETVASLKPLLHESPSFKSMFEDIEELLTEPDLLKKRIGDMGLTEKESQRLVRKLNDMVHSNAKTSQIREALEDGISAPIAKELHGRLQPQFSRAFGEGVDTQLKHACEDFATKRSKTLDEVLGKEWDRYAKEVKEAGDEGFERGVKKAVKESVREGLDDVLKRIRDRSRRRGGGRDDDEEMLARDHSWRRLDDVARDASKTLDDEAAKVAAGPQKGMGPRKYQTIQMNNWLTGKAVTRHEVKDGDADWSVTSIEQSDLDPQTGEAKKNKEAA